MTKEEAIEILRKHNEWRRYDGEVGKGPEMIDPKTLGEAIDTAISELEGMIGGYPTHLDEIDQWLFDSFGIIPGACSSQESLRHDTARMVAEALWPRTLTWKDIDQIQRLYEEVMTDAGGTPRDFVEETLRRFNDLRKK